MAMKKSKTQRESNFELLRIIGMFLILMSHCDEIFGLFDLYGATLGINKIITDWLHMGGQIGVGCFILITGYFMIDKTITPLKMLRIAGEVWFYSIGFWLLVVLIKVFTGKIESFPTLIQTIYAFFPITFCHYWFATAYIILMLFSPFLNKLIISMDKKCYQKLLFVIVMIYVVLKGGVPFAFYDMSEGRLPPMIVLYFIAGYIKRFRGERKNNARRHLSIALVFYFLLLASAYFITYVGLKLDSQLILGGRYFFRVLNSPLVVVICTELFIGFTELKIKYNKFINEVAGCTFGVYLIHMHRLINPLLFKLFPIYKETRSIRIFALSIASVILMYVVFTLVDFIRKRTVERAWLSFLESHLEKAWNRIQKLIGIDSPLVNGIRNLFF